MKKNCQVGDFAQLADYLTDDCEVSVPEMSGASPWISSAKGRENCLAVLRDRFTALEVTNLGLMSFVQDGESVVVAWSAHVRNRGTGPMIEAKGLSRLRFRGGLISQYVNYVDSFALSALAAHA